MTQCTLGLYCWVASRATHCTLGRLLEKGDSLGRPLPLLPWGAVLCLLTSSGTRLALLSWTVASRRSSSSPVCPRWWGEPGNTWGGGLDTWGIVKENLINSKDRFCVERAIHHFPLTILSSIKSNIRNTPITSVHYVGIFISNNTRPPITLQLRFG